MDPFLKESKCGSRLNGHETSFLRERQHIFIKIYRQTFVIQKKSNKCTATAKKTRMFRFILHLEEKFFSLSVFGHVSNLQGDACGKRGVTSTKNRFE